MNMFKFAFKFACLMNHNVRGDPHCIAVSRVAGWVQVLLRFRILEINQRYLAVVALGRHSHHVLPVLGAGL